MLSLLLITFFALPKMGFAVDDADTSANTVNSIAQNVAAIATMGFNFLSFLLYPLMLLISQLMDPDILIGPDMESKLLEIWVQIRNWINMFFVLALVVIALYNVLGVAGEGSNYALKAILPKIVIGLIAVNFSFLAGKVLIDATNVLTNAVYALPTDLGDWKDQVTGVNQRLCWKITGWDVDSTGKKVPKSPLFPLAIDDGKLLSYILCEPGKGTGAEGDTDTEHFTGEFNEFGTSFFSVFGAHNVDLVLMVNMGQVMDIDIAQFSDKTAVDQFATLSMQTLFGIFLFLLFGFAFVAVVVVLAARLIILWICLALSPFVVLLFVFPDLANLGGEQTNLKSTFFQHLFAPVMMGVVFSVGFVMLATLQGSSTGGWLGKIGEITFGDLGNADAMKTYASGTFGRDISDFQDLLVAICAVVVIWVGVFAAASKTIASSWTNAIKGAGEGLGKFLASSPLYATVIPVPGSKKGKDGKPLETMSLGGAIFGSIDKLRNMGNARDEINKKDAKALWGKGTPIQEYADKVESRVKEGSKVDIQKDFRGLAAKSGSDGVKNWVKMLGNSNVKDQLRLGSLPPASLKKLEEAIRDENNDDLVRLLKKDNNIIRKVFGENFTSGQWGVEEVKKEDIGESTESTEAAEPTPEEKEATQKKQEAGKKTLDTGKAALVTAAAATTPATTLEQLDSEGQTKVQEALFQEGLTSQEIINEMFTITGGPEEYEQVKKAMEKCKGNNVKIGDKKLSKVKLTGETIDGASFVEAVNTAYPEEPQAKPAAAQPAVQEETTAVTTPVPEATVPPAPPPPPPPPSPEPSN